MLHGVDKSFGQNVEDKDGCVGDVYSQSLENALLPENTTFY